MATIYLNNISKSKVNWSIDYASDNINGDQEGLSFRIAAVKFADKYTVCYWIDPNTRKCVTVADGDAVTYTGNDVIHTIGG